MWKPKITPYMTISLIKVSGEYLKPSQTSVMEQFSRIGNYDS